MPFKRDDEPLPAESDPKLVDELVRKSLAINPDMRQGRDTQAVIADLRAQAVALSKKGSAKSASPAQSLDATKFTNTAKPASQDPRLATLDIFMRDKAQRYPNAREEIHQRMEALRREAEQLRLNTIREITELVSTLLMSGADAQGVQNTMGHYRDLLSSLKISEMTLLEQACKTRR